MDNYNKIKDIISNSLNDEYAINGIVDLLNKNGITLRQKDGDLIQATISIPASISDSYVIGLRYRKKDNSQTEDCFLIHKGNDRIESFYKGKIEKKLIEYKNTHKAQVSDELLEGNKLGYTPNYFTNVSTHTYIYHKS